jgi:dihydroorotate dehydrogenase (NAD+) catalytic subunit
MPDVPILGMGGIRTGLDALEFVLAGASAVSVGTVTFHDPSAPARVARELAVALAERGFDSLEEAVGYAHRAADPKPAPGGPVAGHGHEVDEPADDTLDAGVEG